MAVTLNRRAYNHAKELISEGRFVFDERDAWVLAQHEYPLSECFEQRPRLSYHIGLTRGDYEQFSRSSCFRPEHGGRHVSLSGFPMSFEQTF